MSPPPSQKEPKIFKVLQDERFNVDRIGATAEKVARLIRAGKSAPQTMDTQQLDVSKRATFSPPPYLLYNLSIRVLSCVV